MPVNNYLQFAFMLMPLVAMLLISDYISRLGMRKLLLSVQRHIERIVGIVTMLIGLLLFTANGWVPTDAMRTSLRWSQATWYWSALLVASSFFAGYAAQFRARQGGYLLQLRALPSELKNAALLVWIIYLLLYEFYFRWLLLPFGKLPTISMWWLNISTYFLIHLPHGKNEAIGSIPYGFLLGLSVIDSGTIWPAFFGHLSLVLAIQFMPWSHLISKGSTFNSTPSSII